VDLVRYIAVAAGGYLIGSIPTGFLMGKIQGIDIRTLGSGNIGATNVFRFLGKPAGIFVLLVDALKGFLSCTVLVRVVESLSSTPQGAVDNELLSIVAGLAAVLGHNFTCWLKFKGGKGVATSAGFLLALIPKAFLITIGTWLLVLALGRYVSLASILAALVLPLAAWLTQGTPRMMMITGVLSLLTLLRHRANMQRLLNGTEHRFGAKRSSSIS